MATLNNYNIIYAIMEFKNILYNNLISLEEVLNLISFNQEVNFRGIKIPAYVEHIYPTGIAAAFRRDHKDKIAKSRGLGPLYRKYNGQDLENKKLLMWRTGGFGDILFMTPLIRRIKKRFPSCEINFSCFPKFSAVLAGNPYVSNLYALPIPLPLFKQHHYQLHFEGTIEKSKNEKLHAIDYFAKHANVNLTNRKLDIRLHKKNRAIARKFVREQLNIKQGEKIIAVQSRASAQLRTYPHPLLIKVMKKLAGEGYKCIVIGLEGAFPEGCDIEGVYDACGKFEWMLDSVALMDECDMLIAPDSSLTHFAAALDLPTVAIYGPFPGEIRTKYYSRCITLEAEHHCIPCMLHKPGPCPEAIKIETIWSPCFDSITPEMIVEEALTILEKGR